MLLDLRSLFEAAVTAISGTGDLTIQGPGLSGTGTVGVEVQQAAGVSRFGPRPIPRRAIHGHGGMEIQGPRLRGSGQIAIVGSGALEIQGPDLHGTGQIRIVGSGAFAVDGPVLHGSGALHLHGRGSMAVSGPAFRGAGQVDEPLIAAWMSGEPDPIDSAWLDLQRAQTDDEDMLLLLGVFDR
jgi:hypothetical protein